MAEPVVLLHSLGLTGAAWEPQLPGLAARRTVLHPDLRGHGGNWDGAAFGIADMVDDLAALLDSHGARRAVRVARDIMQAVAEIAQSGVGVLLVEQNAVMALDLADRAYVLDEGLIQASGPAAEINADPVIRDRYLAV